MLSLGRRHMAGENTVLRGAIHDAPARLHTVRDTMPPDEESPVKTIGLHVGDYMHGRGHFMELRPGQRDVVIEMTSFSKLTAIKGKSTEGRMNQPIAVVMPAGHLGVFRSPSRPPPRVTSPIVGRTLFRSHVRPPLPPPRASFPHSFLSGPIP